MYFDILKKDLKRKRTMNIVLMLFIVLATMFVSSSVNNIINVTTALDDYFEMARAPQFFVATMDKNLTVDVDRVISSADAVEDYKTEDVLYLANENITFENSKISVSLGTQILQSDISMNYFLSDGSILEAVEPGSIYMTEVTATNLGLEEGDKITIECGGVRREFVLADKVKDVLFGSNVSSTTRFIISREDFDAFLSAENTTDYFGGTLHYIYASDTDEALKQIKPLADNSISFADRATMKYIYIFDMIVVGLLLVVSVILILISFVVLRFTISFTLSEEFREIGVMKAIGIPNHKIRSVYLVKYMGLSVIGAAIGLALSFPFGRMLMTVSAQSIIMGNQNPVLINILCAVLVVAIILLFCYGCTRRVNKMTPVDAIRNGQTGERFRKKSIMSLSRSRLPQTSFLALNDIVSSPKRYTIVTLTFFLCLTLLLALSATVSTMKSGSLYSSLGWADCDVFVDNKMVQESMLEDGHKVLKESLEEMEARLAEHGIPAECYREMLFVLPVSFGDNERSIDIYQGTGTTMDTYEYTAGVAPQSAGEIAITKIAANDLGASIGDTVTIKTVDGDMECMITAYFQTMVNSGRAIRLHTEEDINYVQASGIMSTQIKFTDDPEAEEIAARMDEIRKIFPDCLEVESREETVTDMIGVADTLEMVKSLIVILSVVLSALITVLMERSFISKEKGEIALMKAMGMQNGMIYLYHSLRFVIVGVIAVILGEIFAIPIAHLCIDPIFRMMGMELAVDYVINPTEMYVLYPAIILLTTGVSAFLTSLYTGKIKASDTANIE